MQDHPVDYNERGSGAAVPGPADDAADGTHGGEPIRLDARRAAGERLDRFVVAGVAGVSRTRIQRWIPLRPVAVAGAPPLPGPRLRGLESVEV